MTWLTLGVAVVAATLMDRVGTPPGVHVHLGAVLVWAGFGVVVATLLTVLPSFARRSPTVLANLNAVRLCLLAADIVWITADVAVTGGIRGPFWICYVAVVLFAAV